VSILYYSGVKDGSHQVWLRHKGIEDSSGYHDATDPGSAKAVRTGLEQVLCAGGTFSFVHPFASEVPLSEGICYVLVTLQLLPDKVSCVLGARSRGGVKLPSACVACVAVIVVAHSNDQNNRADQRLPQTTASVWARCKRRQSHD
jgi:hypothetical protein